MSKNEEVRTRMIDRKEFLDAGDAKGGRHKYRSRVISDADALATLNDEPSGRRGATKKEAAEPNIIFVGKRFDSKKGESVPGFPPEKIIDGDVIFILPAAANQYEGFYHADAGRITAAFPTLYKRYIKKGETS